MLRIALDLLLVGYVPGALLFRLPVAARERRAALPAEERAFWAVVISVVCSSIVVLCLAAAGRYTFGRLLVADALLSAGLVVVGRRRLGYSGTAPRPGWSVVIPLILIAGGILRYFPTSEYVIGGKDPGVYINEGIAIAQRGTLLLQDPVVAAVPAAVRDLFFPLYPGQAYQSLRFMGFFLLDPAAGTVVGQFPHLYPAWIAIGYGIDGLAGALTVIGWLSIFGVLAVYFAGARLVGRAAAGAAAALLAVSLLQVWFGRYPTSEMLEQPLVFAALLAFARAHIDGDRFFGWIAGALLGLMMFLRVDAALAVAAVALASLLLITQRRLPRASFVASLVLALAAAAAYYLSRLMAPYAARPLGFVANLQPASLLALGFAAAGLSALIFASRNRRVADFIGVWTPRVLAGAAVSAAIYAYFFRQAGGRLAAPDAAAFRTFAWYLPPEALAVAVAGFAFVAWRRFWRDPALFVTVIVFSFFLFYNTQVTRDHFWAARRFVAVIFPAALLMLAALPFAGFWPGASPGLVESRRRRSRASAVLQIALAVLFLGFVGWRLVSLSRPILGHVEYAGVVPRLEALARLFGPDDLVLVEPRYSSDMHVLALPLAYIYHRNVLVLSTPRPDKGRFRTFLEWARTRYRNVYFIGGGGVDLLSRAISAEPVLGDRFQIPEYESRVNGYPTTSRYKEFDYTIYRLVPDLAPLPFQSLAIGAEDNLNIWRFHAKQRQDSTAYRWSRDASYIALPNLQASVRTVTLVMSDGGRPAGSAPARVAVYLDDELLGEATVTGDFRPYAFAIPAALAARAAARDAPAVLRLTCNTWNPHATLGTDDTRDLGVMLHRVEVK